MTENQQKVKMVRDLLDGSIYKTIAHQFLLDKGLQLNCSYWHSVSDPIFQKPAAHTFQSDVYGQHYYHVKVSRKTNSVTEWYRANLNLENSSEPIWVALDMSTGQPIEYYLEGVGGRNVEEKYDSTTNQLIATNHFQRFSEMTAEQQEMIKDLPFKRTSYMWANKNGGFVVEFLPTYLPDIYEGINMANLHLLEIQ
jgi:hypothetical protein